MFLDLQSHLQGMATKSGQSHCWATSINAWWSFYTRQQVVISFFKIIIKFVFRTSLSSFEDSDLLSLDSAAKGLCFNYHLSLLIWFRAVKVSNTSYIGTFWARWTLDYFVAAWIYLNNSNWSPQESYCQPIIASKHWLDGKLQRQNLKRVI